MKLIKKTGQVQLTVNEINFILRFSIIAVTLFLTMFTFSATIGGMMFGSVFIAWLLAKAIGETEV